MLADVPAVPAGSRLVFTYGPTVQEEVSWGLSLVFLVAMLAWVWRPQLFVRVQKGAVGGGGRALRRIVRPLVAGARRWEDEE